MCICVNWMCLTKKGGQINCYLCSVIKKKNNLCIAVQKSAQLAKLNQNRVLHNLCLYICMDQGNVCRPKMALLLHSLLLVRLLSLLYQAVVRHSKPNSISSSRLCPLWVTLSIWARTSSHTQPIYRCNFILAAAKITLRCLLDRVFRSIFMSACVANPPVCQQG